MSHHRSLSWWENRLVRREALRIAARRIVEIGAYDGRTTSILSAAAGCEGRVVAIDPMRRSGIARWIRGECYEEAFWRNVRRSGHDNVMLIRDCTSDGESTQGGPPLPYPLDLLLLHGTLDGAAATASLERWGPRVRVGGLILVQDVGRWSPGMVQAFRHLATSACYRARIPTGLSTVGVAEVLAPLTSSLRPPST